MFNNFSHINNKNFVECTSHGACSISPSGLALQEVMLTLMQHMAFYILKLQTFDIENDKIVTNIVEEISNIDLLSEYTEEQLLTIFLQLYVDLMSLKKIYAKNCDKRNIPGKDIKLKIKLTPDMYLSSIIQEGEKLIKDKHKKTSVYSSEVLDILFGVIKGVCTNLVSCWDLDVTHKKACLEVVNSLNIMNSGRLTVDKIKTKIDKLVQVNIELFELIYKREAELYGAVKEVEVSLATRPGKAILVSGSSLPDLYNVLELTKDLDIDVYSNGNLIVSHAYPKFSEYPHFRGHFGSNSEGTVLDFATFPGATLLTKNEAQHIEYLYRGRLFTTDKIPPKGVVKIKNHDFSPLIESALNSKGFSKGENRGSLTVGYNSEMIAKTLDDIAKKFNSEKYKRLFIIGFSTLIMAENEYLRKFFANIPKDSFVVTFSYKPKNIDFLHINIGQSYSLVYNILSNLGEKILINSDRLYIMLSQCNVLSLSNMAALKEKGAKHIYLSSCSPRIINPSILKVFMEMYDIKSTGNPKSDAEGIAKL